MRWRSGGLAGVVLVLVLTIVPIGRVDAAPVADRGCELRAGVVVDSEQGALYLMAPDDTVEAIDLVSGHVRWRTTAMVKPLALTGKTLIGQGRHTPDGRLVIVGVDPTSGATLPREVTVPLPDGVRASLDDTIYGAFEATASPDGERDRAAIVRWRFTRRAITGQPPTSPTRASPAHANGTARVDLSTGAVEVLKPTALPSPGSARALAGGAASVADADDGARQRVGEFLTRVQRRGRDHADEIILQRWHADTGVALPDITLFSGPLLLTYPSANATQLLVTTRIDAPDAWDRYQWSVYSMETGAQLGAFAQHESATPFVVWGSELVHQAQAYRRQVDDAWIAEPLSVRALMLPNGTRLWTRPLRDTGYRGPLPPRR